MSKAIYYATVEEMPRADLPTNHNFKDLKGQVFGKLTVLHFAGRGSGKNALWAVQCSCETRALLVVAAGNLKNGNTQSCGCHRLLRVKESSTTHGLAKRGNHHYLYGCYDSILRRCYDQTRPEYQSYGGRGIRATFSGVADFVDYIETNLGDRPLGCSLDRINNDGNYEPGNLRWATREVQGRNKRNNLLVTFAGKQMSLAEASELAGIGYRAAYMRIYNGWSEYDALYTPVGQKQVSPAEHLKLEPSNVNQPA